MSSFESESSKPEAFVWTDQDLCSGCGCCEKIAPSVFRLAESGESIVHLDGVASETDGLNGRAISGDEVEKVIEASKECPGEIIFVERY